MCPSDPNAGPVECAHGWTGGVLVLVVGPSGAGKDTLIAGARRALATHPGIVFVRRTITRAPDIWEDHAPATLAEFDAAQCSGAFILSWRAHGLYYGIPMEAKSLADTGCVVVCNASRGIVSEARNRLATVRLVMVDAPAEVLRERLRLRGREADLAERLRRPRLAGDMHVPDLRIENTGPPDEGIVQLTAFLRSLALPMPTGGCRSPAPDDDPR